jgi:hypothetical protein
MQLTLIIHKIGKSRGTTENERKYSTLSCPQFLGQSEFKKHGFVFFLLFTFPAFGS